MLGALLPHGIGEVALLWILHDKLGLKKILSSTGAHTLSINQKSERVSYSKLLLTSLMEPKASEFQRIFTRNELRLFFHYPRDSVWGALRDQGTQRINQKIDTEKCLVSIFWSVSEIHTRLGVPTGTTYNTVFFTVTVVPSLTENVGVRTRGKTLKGWLILMSKTASSQFGGGLKGVSRSQQPNACHVGLTAQIRPRVTSSSLDTSTDNYLITIVRTGRIS
jgi:hypothetical protein